MPRCRATWKPFASSVSKRNRRGVTRARRRWPTTWRVFVRVDLSRLGPWGGWSRHGGGGGATPRTPPDWGAGWADWALSSGTGFGWALSGSRSIPALLAVLP